MNTYTVINTNGNAGYTDFRIHRAGCRDIAHELRASYGHSWDRDATSAKELVEVEVEELNEDFGEGEWCGEDFHVCSCAH